MPDLLDMKEAAAALRRPVATLQFWRYKGIGPKSFKLGGRVVYDRTDVEAFIAEARADV